MSLVGMDLAFKHAVEHPPGTLVAPPPIVSILKMVAFGDRPAQRERDLVDLAHLLDAYVNELDDRRWDDAPVGMEFELTPAYLLGHDIAQVLVLDQHREAVHRFLGSVEAPSSLAHQSMLSSGPTRWKTEENALERRIQAFNLGIGRAPAP